MYKYVSHQKHITPTRVMLLVSLLYTLSLLCAELLEKISVLLRFYFHEALRAVDKFIFMHQTLQLIYYLTFNPFISRMWSPAFSPA